MRSGTMCAVAVAGLALVSSRAEAQFSRCENDALDPQDAAARVEWARKCALTINVGSASNGYALAGSSGSLTEYKEVDTATNPSGKNAYHGNLLGFEINSTYSNSLYRYMPTSQVLDSYGYYKWTNAPSRPYPYFPIYGSASSASSGSQLYPHPQLADCNLYTDRSGYTKATTFYTNLYCDSTSTALSNGVSVTGLSDVTGGEQFYTVIVPEGSVGLSIYTSGGSGNANLYVKRGARPTTSSYDCAKTSTGNYENCSFSSPVPGTYYVMVKGASSYSSVSLMAKWNSLQRDVAVSNLFAGWAVEKHYTFFVPFDVRILTFNISGGTGDADLYVRAAGKPTVTQYDCRPYLGGNSETCSFSFPSPGTYYVMVRGFSTYSGVSLKASYIEDFIEPCLIEPCYLEP